MVPKTLNPKPQTLNPKLGGGRGGGRVLLPGDWKAVSEASVPGPSWKSRTTAHRSMVSCLPGPSKYVE